MDVANFLQSVRNHSAYQQQIAHVEILPERAGVFADLDPSLPESLVQTLATNGIERLYSHQAHSVEAVRGGKDIVVVTGTASGKTLCYNLPILETLVADPDSRALYLFPTKALAQDQFKGLLEWMHGERGSGDSDTSETGARSLFTANQSAQSSAQSSGKDSAQSSGKESAGGASLLAQVIRPGVYDGDTPTAQRRQIQAKGNLVLSNPDMLHASILPYHPRWARFFSQLKFVVIDEVHSYRGILGANVSCVLRRLLRVCEHYGSRPQFLCASATIANPGELVERLIGRPVTVIDDDGSPRGRKYFCLWNPAAEGNDSLARRSATDDAVWLVAEAIEAGAQTLAFTRTRQAAELVYRYVQDELRARHSPHVDSVRAYRGGYLPNERRAMERDLFHGRLRGVAATNALELGVDIGSLDVALLTHYPGSIASTWQQAGRSGRRHEDSLAILLAGNDPVDQYLLRNPDYFFAQTPEHAVVDPENPYVLANHLKAAAFELPLRDDTTVQFGDMAPTIANVIAETGELSLIDGHFYYAGGGQNPAHRISLRHMSDDTFSIILVTDRRPPGMPDVLPQSALESLRSRSGRYRLGGLSRSELAQGFQVIANVDAISAPELVYPEAVYLHNGDSYFVNRLDLDNKVAYVQRHEMDYYTQAVLESNVLITRELETRCEHAPERLSSFLAFGEVDVSWKTVAFKKIKFETRENVGYGSVEIPAQHLPTTAFWLAPGQDIRDQLKSEKLRVGEALCGLRNLAVVALPMVAMCDMRDISGVVDSQNLGRSTMIIYDRYPGGLGYAEKGYYQIESLIRLCHELIDQCPCAEGCPSCVGLPNLRPAIHSDPDLMRGYPIPNKRATLRLLELLVQPNHPATVPADVASSVH